MPFHRECEKCGKRFKPFSRNNKLCPDCNTNGKWINKMFKKSMSLETKRHREKIRLDKMGKRAEDYS